MTSMSLPTPHELLPLDRNYPTCLRSLSDHGPIRVSGALPPLEKAIAIVGTRRADPEALDFAEEIAGDLARAGCVIVSGGALGVDAAAHRGALRVGGVTVAVLASGLAKPYPKQHGSLFEKIVSSGALLTEAPDDAVVRGFRFLHRNRLIAALSVATLVIQAPERSGTLSTAAAAKRLARPVFVVPTAPWDSRGKGGLTLLLEGARICTSAADVLSVFAPGTCDMQLRTALSLEKPKDLNSLHALGGLPTEARTLLPKLGGRGRTLDEISIATGWPAHRVLSVLTSLEVAGWIERRSGGRYGKVGPHSRH